MGLFKRKPKEEDTWVPVTAEEVVEVVQQRMVNRAKEISDLSSDVGDMNLGHLNNLIQKATTLEEIKRLRSLRDKGQRLKSLKFWQTKDMERLSQPKWHARILNDHRERP